MMSVQVVNSTLVYGNGLSDQVFDLGGITYKRGDALGDKQIIQLVGIRNKIINLKLDDSNLSGVTGVCSIKGIDNEISYVTLDNCQRYGFIVVGALRAKLSYLKIFKGQHCISGSSGTVGDWRSPSIDTIIENCYIRGMIIDGIKLKQMIGTIIRNNVIDVFPYNPGYIGGTTTYSKSGIYFASTDTASKDCIIENNYIYQYGTHALKNRAVLFNPDQTVDTNVFSFGNKVRNNVFVGMDMGVVIKGNDNLIEGNNMINVRSKYINTGLRNTIIEPTLKPRNLTALFSPINL